MYKKNQLEVNVPLSKLNPMQGMLIDSLDWMIYVQLRAGRGWLIFAGNMSHVRVAIASSRLIMCLPSSNLWKSTSQKFFWVSEPGNSVSSPFQLCFFFSFGLITATILMVLTCSISDLEVHFERADPYGLFFIHMGHFIHKKIS